MNKKMFILPLLLMGTTFCLQAQTQQNEDIVIHRKGNPQQKTTIVIDGKNITVNGKPVDQWKDGSVEIMKTDSSYNIFNLNNLQSGLEKMFGQTMPKGGVQFFRRMGPGINNITTNKAKLGVYTNKAENTKGVVIKEVSENSPADKAGLKQGDIILKVNNTDIETSEDLYKTIGKYNAGDTINITYLRDGKTSNTQAVLEKNNSFQLDNENQWGMRNFNFSMPPMPMNPDFNFMPNNKPMLGVQIEELNDNSGVKINEVNSNSPAEKAGLEKGDILTQMDGNAVKSIEDLKQALSNKNVGDSVEISYLRNGKKHNATVVFPKPIKKATL
ncbi:PDZ domain-containing protein [Hydrotalea sp.]|uniref:PDZ domain-containing protein n=1 Tax=Hydrotalea sp. TaxID=2881279 RepID=UPI003D0AA713